MADEETQKNSTNNEEIEYKNPNFFKKVWYSVMKFEKYPEMAAEGCPRALKYLCQMMAAFSLVITVAITIQLYQTVQKGINYLEKDFPEFLYKDGILKVESDETIKLENVERLGKLIIDTNTDNEEIINQYINSIPNEKEGIIILKDKMILKNLLSSGEIRYNYKDLLNNLSGNISEFKKEDIINYAYGNQISSLYFTFGAVIFIYTWIMYIISILMDTLILSILGWITSLIARIKIRFVAIFNMAAYAITLSTILNLIYFVVNMFTGFKITYFQVMYTSVAYIYLVTAIFIIKSEFIKKQSELMKIIEEQEKNIDKTLENQEDTNKNDDKKKDNKDKKEEQKDDDKEEPEGSNA